MIYVIPELQNPTGITWPVERRKAFMDVINKYDVVVVEDDPTVKIRHTSKVAVPEVHGYAGESRIPRLILEDFHAGPAPGAGRLLIRKLSIARQIQGGAVDLGH